MERRRRIAVFGGVAAAVQNRVPLVTSNKARAQYGLAPLRNPDGSASRNNTLRPQRFGAVVKVYVEQFSAK
jgi:hypothetical protein